MRGDQGSQRAVQRGIGSGLPTSRSELRGIRPNPRGIGTMRQRKRFGRAAIAGSGDRGRRDHIEPEPARRVQIAPAPARHGPGPAGALGTEVRAMALEGVIDGRLGTRRMPLWPA